MALSKIKSSSMADTAIHGRRNLVINGAMQVAQRGTSKSQPSGGYDTVDRFLVEGRTGQGGVSTVTQESFTPAASYPALLKNYFQLAITATPSSNPMRIEQRIEDCITLNGQVVTLSFWGKVTSGTFDVTTNYENNSGGSGGTVQGSSSHTLTTTWIRFTETVTLPTVSSGTTGSSTYLSIQILFPIASGLNTVQITGIQLEAGSQATPFEHRSYGEELALCQRYYTVLAKGAGSDASFGMGNAYKTSQAYGSINYPVEMRTTPSLFQVDATNYFIFFNNNTSDLFNAVTLSKAGTRALEFSTPQTLGLIQGQSGFFRTYNASSYLAVGAEL